MEKKRILCFGDSNTWGFMPGSGLRYPFETRWTGVVASLLGQGYQILEDGINGRTTAMDLPWLPWRNGQASLPYALLAQMPLEMVVIALGINDLVTGADADYSGKCIEGLIRTVRMTAALPDTALFENGEKILIVSPTPVQPDYDVQRGNVRTDRRERSLQLAAVYRKVAEENGAYFLDGSACAVCSPIDCVHLDPEGHRLLGTAIAEKIRNIIDKCAHPV